MKWLHRCWWQMLKTKCVDDSFMMLVTVLAILVTNILYLLTIAVGTNANSKIVTVSDQHQNVNNMTVAQLWWTYPR